MTRKVIPLSAGDFYFAFNATWEFFHDKGGEDGLAQYWRDLGKGYYSYLTERFREGGLPAVCDYWSEFFADEPGAEVDVIHTDDEVLLDIRVCPAIRWLREAGREAVPYYCDHCRHVTESICEGTGIEFELEGGMGSCRQVFRRKGGGQA